MTDLATAIATIRGLRSQEDFAADIGVTRQTVIQWEAGRTVPSLKQARMLVADGVPIELFIADRVADADKGAA